MLDHCAIRICRFVPATKGESFSYQMYDFWRNLVVAQSKANALGSSATYHPRQPPLVSRLQSLLTRFVLCPCNPLPLSTSAWQRRFLRLDSAWWANLLAHTIQLSKARCPEYRKAFRYLPLGYLDCRHGRRCVLFNLHHGLSSLERYGAIALKSVCSLA